ncbi:hypothetical protein NSA02_03990, partial [Ligilactobacillus murinus]|nr:hypothetical protein [Ligilactobacillus murinus]
MEFYGPIIGKFILGMLCIILQINIVGKRNLAPVTALDQVQNYVLGGVIGGIIYNQDITVLQFLMVLIIWTLVVMVLQFLMTPSRKSRDFSHGMDRPLLNPFMGLFVCFCIFLVIDIFLYNFFAHIAQCT